MIASEKFLNDINDLQTENDPTMDSNEFSVRLPNLLFIATLLFVLISGCSATTPKWIEQPWSPISSAGMESLSPTSDAAISNTSVAVTDGNEQPNTNRKPEQGRGILVANRINSDSGQADIALTSHQDIVRGQDPGYPTYTPGSYVPPAGNGQFSPSGGQFQTPAAPTQGYQPQQQPSSYPTYTQSPQVIPPAPVAVPNTGAPNQLPGYFDPVAPVGNYVPPNYADIDVLVREAQTGKMTFGAAYNSNSGLVGQIIIDERNFDILGFPRSISEIQNGTAWRGRGQGFRLELVPGNEVQRYLMSFTEPYLFNSQVSFSASGYFFDRRYEDWDEQRLGGRISFGYRLTPDLSLSVGLRMEEVNIHDPRVNTSPRLNSVLGDNSLYLAQFSLINDTRDHPYMATEGSYLELSYHQGFGDFDYPRGDLDYRRYWLVSQRPDQSGRHTLSFGTKVGVSGSSTPLFENYYAGGFSTLRGFDFRGASPVEGGASVGGRFQWLNTLEYTFPITADDMFKGVFFCDFGTVEQDIELNADNFRVAPGFGFRVHMPVGGAGGAPLAFDFAFPIEEAATDDKQVFSFYMGVNR